MGRDGRAEQGQIEILVIRLVKETTETRNKHGS